MSCATCGADTRRFKSGKPHKYCEACASLSCPRCSGSKSRGALRCTECRAQDVAPPAVECQGCGERFRPKQRRYSTYCSRRCAYRHQFQWDAQMASGNFRSSPLTIKACKTCGGQFIARPTSRLYCSETCSYRTLIAAPSEHTCDDCGLSFVSDWGDKRTRFCSQKCGKRYVRRQRRRRHGHRNKHRRRARAAGVEHEPISRRKVLERDDWRCGICGGRISKTVKYPHPRSPSLDHIVPIAKGGPHLYRNVQAAHFKCNTLKSDGVAATDQLRLVG